MNDGKTSRDRMAARPFAPIDSDVDSRNTHALDYIAFYLGAIEQHLGAIAATMERSQADQAAVASARAKAALRTPSLKPAMEFFRPSESQDQPPRRAGRSGGQRLRPADTDHAKARGATPHR